MLLSLRRATTPCTRQWWRHAADGRLVSPGVVLRIDTLPSSRTGELNPQLRNRDYWPKQGLQSTPTGWAGSGRGLGRAGGGGRAGPGAGWGLGRLDGPISGPYIRILAGYPGRPGYGPIETGTILDIALTISKTLVAEVQPGVGVFQLEDRDYKSQKMTGTNSTQKPGL
jgi:hypothetical protein